MKKEVDKAAEAKLKSMNAWGDTGEKKSFGLTGFTKFTFPRLWTGGCWRKFLVVLNILIMLLLKVSSIFIPLLLKEVIDAITCEAKTVKTTDKFLLRKEEFGCPSEQETYILVGLYAIVKFLNDFINYIREIPYANMAALAEISIAHDVYDHVQR